MPCLISWLGVKWGRRKMTILVDDSSVFTQIKKVCYFVFTINITFVELFMWRSFTIKNLKFKIKRTAVRKTNAGHTCPLFWHYAIVLIHLYLIVLVYFLTQQSIWWGLILGNTCRQVFQGFHSRINAKGFCKRLGILQADLFRSRLIASLSFSPRRDIWQIDAFCYT